jgi:hypothetical protein
MNSRYPLVPYQGHSLVPYQKQINQTIPKLNKIPTYKTPIHKTSSYSDREKIKRGLGKLKYDSPMTKSEMINTFIINSPLMLAKKKKKGINESYMSPMMKAHSTLEMLKQKPTSSAEFNSPTMIGVPKSLKPPKQQTTSAILKRSVKPPIGRDMDVMKKNIENAPKKKRKTGIKLLVASVLEQEFGKSAQNTFAKTSAANRVRQDQHKPTTKMARSNLRTPSNIEDVPAEKVMRPPRWSSKKA